MCTPANARRFSPVAARLIINQPVLRDFRKFLLFRHRIMSGRASYFTRTVAVEIVRFNLSTRGSRWPWNAHLRQNFLRVPFYHCFMHNRRHLGGLNLKAILLKMLGLHLYTLIIGHKSCNFLSILNKLTL